MMTFDAAGLFLELLINHRNNRKSQRESKKKKEKQKHL